MYNDKWKFFDNLPGKEALSSAEVQYWLSILNKVLKTGVEFEFNLKEPKGFCKGGSESCPCIKMTEDNDCWKVCLLQNTCKKKFNTLEEFKLNCHGKFCVSFKSACISCKFSKIDCTKCNYLLDTSSDPESIRQQLKNAFDPSKSYGNLSKSGVHSVVTDGSLLGGEGKEKGVEIITVGRRIDYWEFYNMLSNITKNSINKGAYVNERCSTHIHVLAGYLDAVENNSNFRAVSELEKPMPQIIVANFHQLCRRYQNAITWMSMGLDNPEHLTRWEKYRVSILDTSPVTMSMEDIIHKLEEISFKNRGKYAWVNYMYSKSKGSSAELERFHVEMRVLDGMMSASVVAAMCCLFHALVIKAVEISRYGLLELGSLPWFEQTKDIKSRLLNNAPAGFSENRLSDTMDLLPKHQDILKVESYDLLNQIKHILMRTGPAFEVLEKLAEKPVAFHRCEGKNWEEIEKHFEVFREEETILEQKINEIIDFRIVMRCENDKVWSDKVAALLEKEDIASKNQIPEIISAKIRNGLCIWSSSLGTVLKV